MNTALQTPPRPARRRLLLAAAAAAVGAAAPVRGDAVFPSRSVRWIVPYSVGVGPDVVARSVAQQLARLWAQPVVVDNKPGASGIVAFAEARLVPPDGHTLFLADVATLAVNPLLHATLPYDVARDLAPLTLLFHATFVLFTGGGNRHATLAAMLDSARREPGRISYASLGNGHASHVAMEHFAAAAGVQMLHVPFKDAGALMTAVVAGDVDITAFGMNTVAGLVAHGRMRALAVADTQRLLSHPEVPTLPEAGGPAVTMHPWAAVVGVAGTPQPVLEKLQRDIVAAMSSTEVKSRAELAGFEITPSTPQTLRARIAAETGRVAPLVAAGRIARI